MLLALFKTDSDFLINVQFSDGSYEARQLMAEKYSVQPIRALFAGLSSHFYFGSKYK